MALGVPLALAGARSMRALLYGVTPFDPGPLIAGAAVLVVVGLGAAILPTRHASQVDPVVALRAD